MATSKVWVLTLAWANAAAWSHDATPAACQAVAAQPAIANAKAAIRQNPTDLRPHFRLADAWSDAGCFNEALQVLQAADAAHPGDKELQTRLRVAKSLVGEEHFFDNLDRADDEAKLKRAAFRCTTLSDLEACIEAIRMKPDDAVLMAKADTLMRAKPPAEASATATGAGTPTEPPHIAATPVRAAPKERPVLKIQVARANLSEAPVRHYSNAAPEAHSH